MGDFSRYGQLDRIRLWRGCTHPPAQWSVSGSLTPQVPGTRGEGFEDTVLTESADGGKSWSKPWRMGNNAEVHAYLTELRDGRLVCTYSNYHLPWGTYAIVSKDGGKTWDLDRPIQLSLSAGIWVGWPVTLQLPDDSLVTCCAATTHYGQEPDKFSTEVIRWRLPKKL